jgi:hypothetical protein
MRAAGERFVLIRPTYAVDEAIKLAAWQRHIPKALLIEKLLSVITRDNLINAVLDDGGEWNNSAVSPTTSPR